jgi:sirohydrochlorin ferrochelatase
VAPPLGPSPLLTTALVDRARSAGADDGDPVVLAAAGSSDPAATAAVRRAVRLLDEAWTGPVSCCFVSHQAPGVDTAVAAAARQTGRVVTVVPYLLAPGRFAAALAEVVGRHPPARVSAPLAGHPAVADLVVRRYRATAPGPQGPTWPVRRPPNLAADGLVTQAG